MCEVRPLQVDQPKSVSDFAAWIGRQAGHVDHLINAAGVTSRGPSEQFPLAEWERILQINLTGTFLTCRALATLLMNGHESTIVNVASELAIAVEPEKAAYVASKAGVIGLTKVLGVEWVARGIRVNCVAPGATRTPMIAHIENDPIVRDAYLSRVPARRFAEPEEIANGIAFLSSRLSSHVVGQVLVIDGGYTVG
jgi:3-oxoacyl-[acyl-carrier protein] reductase